MKKLPGVEMDRHLQGTVRAEDTRVDKPAKRGTGKKRFQGTVTSKPFCSTDLSLSASRLNFH